MKPITTYLATLASDSRESFAARCGTSINYLRKASSTGQKIGESLCIALERESARAIRCEDLRPDVDWAYLRNTPELAQAHIHQAQPATECIASDTTDCTGNADALRTGTIRRQDDRRANGNPAFQNLEAGVA